MPAPLLHNMKAVERRTGLSAHLIRMWERRYGAVTPARSVARQRLFSEDEVQRLNLLGRLTRGGLTIGRIARLPVEELKLLLQNHDCRPQRAPENQPGPEEIIGELLEESMQAIRHYNISAVNRILDRGLLALGYSGLLEKVMIPLLQHVGDAWENGSITAAQEHLATAATRDYLAFNTQGSSPEAHAPRLLVTTPAGQLHEMGAVIAACLARKAGWNVIYLGPSLPAGEIAGVVASQRVQALALSLVYPADDPEVHRQLLKMRHLMPEPFPIIAGGRALTGYQKSLEKISAVVLTGMEQFTPALARIRQNQSSRAELAAT